MNNATGRRARLAIWARRSGFLSESTPVRLARGCASSGRSFPRPWHGWAADATQQVPHSSTPVPRPQFSEWVLPLSILAVFSTYGQLLYDYGVPSVLKSQQSLPVKGPAGSTLLL